MPLQDWTGVPAGLFHDFRQSWSIRLTDALNAGRLPPGVSALVEPPISNLPAGVLGIGARGCRQIEEDQGDVAIADPPQTRIVRRTDKEIYASLANRVVIRHHLARAMAIIEIVSPGNKSSRAALADFTEKTVQYLRCGVHALIVDPFPPTDRDPGGMHKAIWDWIDEEPFELPPGKDRTLASYQAGYERAAYVETVGVGDELPAMPLFLTTELHVSVPLEATYMATWDASPEALRTAVETGIMPAPGGD
jgi:hypothetical protein